MQALGSLCIVLFVFLIPCESLVKFEGVGTVSRGVGILAFGVASLAALWLNRIRMIPRELWLLSVFVFWCVSTYVWSIAPELAFSRSMTYLQMLLMVWLLWQWTLDSPSIHRVIGAYLLGASVSIGFTVHNYLFQKQVVWQRYAAAGFDPNELGLILAIGIPLAWYLGFKVDSGWQRLLCRLYPLAAVVGVVLTGSRTAAAVSLIALLFIAINLIRLSWQSRGVLLITLVGLVPLGASYLPMTSLQRIATLGKEVSSGTLNNRSTIWRAGVEAFSQDLFVGTGVGTFPAAVKPFLGEAVVAHNLYLTIAVESGGVGLLLFAAFLGMVLVRICRLPCLERQLWLTVLAVWGVGVATLSWDARKTTWLLFVLVLSHATAIRRVAPASSGQQVGGV